MGVMPTAALANGNNNSLPPSHLGPGQGNPYDRYGGQFLVILCGPYAGYNWVESWQNGKTLAEPVSLIGTCYWGNGTTHTYKIEIPAGTVISGYYPGQGSVIYLEITCVEGQLYFSPNLKLSQPATLYMLVDGEWVEVLSFTQVLDGKAS